MLGKALAEEHPVLPDTDTEPVRAIGVPDSANTATIGFAQNATKNNIPTRYEIGLIRSHYVWTDVYCAGARPARVQGENKVQHSAWCTGKSQSGLIDDSIVRGTTSRSIVRLVREAAPREVHLRISSPPVTHPCMYGMDFPDREELIANQYHSNEEEIAVALEADLGAVFIGRKIVGCRSARCRLIVGVFHGKYPVAIDTSGGNFRPSKNNRVIEKNYTVCTEILPTQFAPSWMNGFRPQSVTAKWFMYPFLVLVQWRPRDDSRIYELQKAASGQ